VIISFILHRGIT